MADNDKPKEPGSITQNSDTQDERISEISNVNRTISNMQKNVESRLEQIDEEAGDKESISEVHNSMRKLLVAMSGTVGDIGKGFTNIAKTTAQTTTDSIKQYGKAVSEDISYNKQNIVAMALSRSTPIFGYFAAKFMETDVFKSAAERMKANIGEALSGIGGKFKSIFKGKSKGEKESPVPKMQKGGYVEKAGMAYLHPAEVVMPIEKVLERIDESISVAKDLAAISKNTQLSTMAKLSTFVGEQKKFQKTGIVKGFINAYSEVQNRYMGPSDKRMLRAVLAIQDSIGATVGTWPQVWQKMLVEHPFFRNLVFSVRSLYKTISLPAKLTYALFKRRGGYEGQLSSDKNPLAATAYNVGLLYTGSMWRLDTIAKYNRATAEATRDLSSAITGKRYPRLEGVGPPFFSLIRIGRKLLNFTAKWTPALTGAFVDALTGGTGKKGWSIGRSIGETLTSDTFLTAWIEKARNLLPGIRRETEIYGIGGAVEALPDIQSEAAKRGAIPVFMKNPELMDLAETSKKELKSTTLQERLEQGKMKLQKRMAKFQEQSVELSKKMLFRQRLKAMFGLAGGALSKVLGFFTGGGLLSLLGKGGGLLKGLGKGLLGAMGYGGIQGGILGTVVPKLTNVFTKIFTNPLVWKGGALAFAGFIGWQIGKLIDRLFGISEKFEALQNKWDKASRDLGREVTKAQNVAFKAAREKGGKEGFVGKESLKYSAGLGRVSTERREDVGFWGRRHIAGIEAAQRKFIQDNINEYMKYGPEQVDLLRQRWLNEGGFVAKAGMDHIKYGQMREKNFLTYLQRYGTVRSEAELNKAYTDYKVQFAKEHPGRAMYIEGKEYATRKGQELTEAVKAGIGTVTEKAVGAYTKTTELAAQETRKLAANTKELRDTMKEWGDKAAEATREAGKGMEQHLTRATNVVSNNISQTTQRITNVGRGARQELDLYTENIIRGNTLEDHY